MNENKSSQDIAVEKWLHVIEIQTKLAEMRRVLDHERLALGLSSSGISVFQPHVVQNAFTRNCVSQEDKSYIYGKLLKTDLTMATSYFTTHCTAGNKGRHQWDKHLRNEAFKNILLNPDRLWELTSSENDYMTIDWLPEERDMAYKVYNEFFKKEFGSGIINICIYVRLFEHRCDRKTIDLMLRRIIGRKHKEYATHFLNNYRLYNLTANDCDTLHSTLLYHELAGTKKRR